MAVAARLLLVSVLIAGCSGASAGPSTGFVGDTPHGSVRIQLDYTGLSNPAPTHVRANQVSVSFYDAASGARAINIGGWIDEGNGAFRKSWQFVLDLFGEPATGKVFLIDGPQPSTAPDTAWISLQDETVTVWRSMGGSVTVQSLASLRATFSLDAVTLVPVDATGIIMNGTSITMNGTVTIANINNVCDCID